MPGDVNVNLDELRGIAMGRLDAWIAPLAVCGPWNPPEPRYDRQVIENVVDPKTSNDTWVHSTFSPWALAPIRGMYGRALVNC
jgi:hypothetical protein